MLTTITPSNQLSFVFSEIKKTFAIVSPELASKKKDKWNQYEATTRTLKQAESYLEERGWTLEGKAK